jgi:hypothetical protein
MMGWNLSRCVNVEDSLFGWLGKGMNMAWDAMNGNKTEIRIEVSNLWHIYIEASSSVDEQTQSEA